MSPLAETATPIFYVVVYKYNNEKKDSDT
jgi:hypothetical protein